MKRLLVVLGVAGVSLSAIFVRWATAPSLVLAFYRMIMAAILLAPVVLWKNREELKQLEKREWILCIISGTFLGLHFAAYFESLRWTSIASSVVLVDTEVLFVALGTWLILRKRLSGKAWLAVAMAFGGSVVIAMADTAAGSDVVRGDLIALSGALFMAVYTMIGAVCRRRLSTNVYTFLVYSVAAAALLVILVITDTSLYGYGGINYLSGFGMAVFCTLLGHSVFSWGLKYLPPAFISTAKLLEPVFASVWGLFLFGEVPGGPVILGGLVILLGIALYSQISET
jgi:drug/metabolite transporter (DMT)-like permease